MSAPRRGTAVQGACCSRARRNIDNERHRSDFTVGHELDPERIATRVKRRCVQHHLCADRARRVMRRAVGTVRGVGCTRWHRMRVDIRQVIGAHEHRVRRRAKARR